MSTIAHATIVMERTYNASPARVFAAWADKNAVARWYVPGDGSWQSEIQEHDFRVGGRHLMTFGPKGGDVYGEDCRFEDIVANKRICYAMTVTTNATRISASMVTVEFFARGNRTEVKVTDQMAALDGGDTGDGRKAGWGDTLDKLVPELARA